MMILSMLVTAAMLKCPPTKMNIVGPLDRDDKVALQEHSDRCLMTKSWPCLYAFEKASKGVYRSTCGSLVEDKSN